MTWYPECAATPEDDGPNFISPTIGNLVAPEVRRLREAHAFRTVSKEATAFHEKSARKHGLDTPVGLAHFKAACSYREAAGRLQEMFENGGEIGELPPSAIIKANKAAIGFHKQQAEKAGIDSDQGHAHIAALEHHLDILNKARQKHKASKQQVQASAEEGGPGSGPHKGGKWSPQTDPNINKKLKHGPESQTTGRVNRLRKLATRFEKAGNVKDARLMKNRINALLGEAAPGHSGKQSPVPVPKKSEQPNEDIRQDLPPVPLRKLQQKREARGEEFCTSPVRKLVRKDLVFRAKKPGREASGMVAQRYDKSHPEGFVDPRYPELKGHLGESKRGWPARQKKMHRKMGADLHHRSMESRRGDEDAPRVINLRDFAGTPRREEGGGWRNGSVYTPPVTKKVEETGLVIKEF